MKIAEIFYSLQGEGILTGVPSVFVRTSGCNLRCTWCDTPYTSWQPEGEELAVDRIVAAVTGHHASHAVVTGGEPMIAPDIVTLTERLREAGLHITIETAGTVFALVACDLMSISPKLRNSTPHERDGGRWAAQHDRLRCQPDVLRRLTDGYEYQLKFVIAAPNDVEEVGRDPTGNRSGSSTGHSHAGGYAPRNRTGAGPVAGRDLQARRLPVQPAIAYRPLGRPAGSLIH